MAAYVDRHSLNVEIIRILGLDATIQSLLGNPPRMHVDVPKNVVFPFVRVDSTPAGPLVGAMKASPGVTWIRQHGVQFTAFDLPRTLAGVAAIQKAIADVMDVFPSNAAIVGVRVTMANPVLDHPPDFTDEDKPSAFSVLEYLITYE